MFENLHIFNAYKIDYYLWILNSKKKLTTTTVFLHDRKKHSNFFSITKSNLLPTKRKQFQRTSLHKLFLLVSHRHKYKETYKEFQNRRNVYTDPIKSLAIWARICQQKHVLLSKRMRLSFSEANFTHPLAKPTRSRLKQNYHNMRRLLELTELKRK